VSSLEAADGSAAQADTSEDSSSSTGETASGDEAPLDQEQDSEATDLLAPATLDDESATDAEADADAEVALLGTVEADDNAASADGFDDGDAMESDDAQDDAADAQPDEALESTAPGALLIIDARVADQQTLLADLPSNTTVRVIESNESGIDAVGQELASGGVFDTIHIVSHGTSGSLTLGSDTIDNESINSQSAALQSWASYLTDDADILLYGCDIAEGESGQTLVSQLAHLTGADIAASTDDTGAADKGGDWVLEASTGNIEATALAVAAYSELLAATAITDSGSAAPRATTEDTPLAITGLAVSGNAADTITLTIVTTGGAANLGTTTGLTVAGNASNSITVTGTIADVNTALNSLAYTPEADQNSSTPGFSPSISLDVTAGGVGSLTVSNISVSPVNDASSIDAQGLLEVDEGGTFSFDAAIASDLGFTQTQLGITDVDNGALQVIFKVVDPLPGHGTLLLNGVELAAGSTFSAADIGSLTYRHDSTQVLAPTVDTLLFTIDDGAGGVVENQAFNITINPVNQLPELTSTIRVIEGESSVNLFDNGLLPTIGTERGQIDVADPDQAAGVPHTYRLDSLPAQGELFYDGTLITDPNFVVADLSLLTYTHGGSEPSGPSGNTDSFTIIAIDDGGGTAVPGESTPQTITLSIIDNNNDPELTTNVPQDLTTDHGGASSFDVTSDMLEVTDSDSFDANLSYTVTDVPDPNLGYMTIDGARLIVGSVFTQQDIDDGRIRYVSHTVQADERVDAFSFTVLDGGVRLYPYEREGGIYEPGTDNLQVNTFEVTVPGGTGDPAPLPPPQAAVPVATVIGDQSFLVNEAGEYTLQTADLSASDGVTGTDGLTYRLSTLPSNGTFYRDGVALPQFGSFTQADIDAGLVTFTHNGSEDFTADFQFSVSNGKLTTADQTFSISATPQNDTPVATIGAERVFLAEGTETVIDMSHIVLSDSDAVSDSAQLGTGSFENADPAYANANALSFEITELPTHGVLTLNGVPLGVGDFVTQAQLDNGEFRYVHDSSEFFSDGFTLVPMDNQLVDPTVGTNNTSRGEALVVPIIISPLNDAPEFEEKNQLIAGEAGAIYEGSSATIGGLGASGANLAYSDTDNSSVQRQYRVTAATEYGQLLLNGSPLGLGSVFTQDDLDSGRITYQHSGAENTPNDEFSYVVSDGDYTANEDGSFEQGQASASSTFLIEILPANDAPEITSASTSLVVDSAINGVALPSITLADVDLGDGVQAGESDFVQVTVAFLDGASPYADGVLAFSGVPAGVTVVGSTGGSTLVFQGSLTDVQAALDQVTARTLVDADRDDLSIRVTVDDRLRDSAGDLLAGVDVGANGGDVNQVAANGDAVPFGTDFNTASIVFDVSASSVNDLPVVTADNLVVNEDARTQLTGISFTDPDAFGSTSNSVTLTVESGTLDVPAASRPSGYVWNAATHTLTLSGTKDQLDTALANLYYTSASNYNGADQLTIEVDDGGNTGADGYSGNPADNSQTVDIAINPVNDRPTITTPTGTQVLTDGVYTFAPGELAFNDAADISNSTTATDPFTEGVDEYTITLSANLSGSYGTINVPVTTGLTVVTGNNTPDTDVVLTGTRADLLAALNSGITYTPTDTNADASIAFTMTVDDGDNGGTELLYGVAGPQTRSGTFNLIVSDVNQAPVIDGLDSTSGNTYTENGPAIVIDPDVVLSDPELDLFPNGWNNATLTIGRDGGVNAEDVLGVDPSSSVTLSGGNVLVGGTVVGTFTNSGGALSFVFNGSATPTRVDQVIQAITYSNTSELPPASVDLAYSVNDQNVNTGGTGAAGTGQDQGTGGLLTDLAVITVGITRAVDAPVVTPSTNPTAVFSENTNATPGGTPVAVDSGITLTDLDDDNIHSATVQITTGLVTADVLSVSTAGTGITASYNAATGTLTLTGVDTKENYEDVLQSLTFANTGDDPNNNNTQTSRELTYTVNDNGSSGAGTAGLNPGTTTRNVTIVPWNDTPALTGAGSMVNYTENDAPVTLEPGTAAAWGLSDTDDTQMVQATAQITAGLHADDVLAISAADLPGDWTQSYDAATGLLTLSGSPADTADVIAALSAVTYVNTGEDPGDTTRTVTWQLTDANSDSASNGQLLSNTVTTTLNVLPVNDPPVATNDVNTVAEDGAAVTGNVKTDVDGPSGDPDSDPDNAMADVPVTGIVATTAGGPVQTVTGPTTVTGEYGLLVINPDGSYTYTLDNTNPDVNALGDTDTLADVFTYTITDPDNASATATLTITIDGNTDGGPAVVPVDGNAPGAADGVATVYESGLTSDGPAGESETASGSIALSAPDNIASITVGGTVVTLAELQALAPGNTIDIDTGEGTLTLTGFTQSGTGAVTNGDLAYTYTLKDDLPHTGPDAESSLDNIPLIITDARDATANGELLIQIVDDVPTANPDTGSVDKEVGTLTGNVVTDASTGDRMGADGPATAGPVTGIVAGSSAGPVSTGVGASVTGTYGTVTLLPDGSYTYVVDPANADVIALGFGDSLSDVFTYTITDADGDTSTTTLTIGIDGNLRPVASDDAFTTDEDTPLSGSLQGNDTLGDGSAAEHTWEKLTDPANGTVVVNPDGSFVYTPNANFNGTDSFTYTVTDKDGNTSTATVNLTVTSVNDVPVAVNDRTTTGYETPVSGSLTGNDTPSGDGGNVWTQATPPSNGRVVVNPDGTYRYTPNPGFSGTDSFTYTITDANGDTSTATMTITVAAGPVVVVTEPAQPPAAPLAPVDPRPGISPAWPPVPEVHLQPLNPLDGDQAREESVYFDGGVFNRVARLPIPMHPVVYVSPGVNAAQAEREATDTRYYSDPAAAHRGEIQSGSIGAGLGMDPVVYVQHAVRESHARSVWLDEVVNGRLGRISLSSDSLIRTPEWFEPLPENIVPEMPGDKGAAPDASKAPGEAEKGAVKTGEMEKPPAAPARPVAIDRPAGQGMVSGQALRPAAAPSFSDQLRSSAARVPAAS
jgi:VCBS repeat-containing protein